MASPPGAKLNCSYCGFTSWSNGFTAKPLKRPFYFLLLVGPLCARLIKLCYIGQRLRKKPAAQAAGADPSWCNSTNRPNQSCMLYVSSVSVTAVYLSREERGAADHRNIAAIYSLLEKLYWLQPVTPAVSRCIHNCILVIGRRPQKGKNIFFLLICFLSIKEIGN